MSGKYNHLMKQEDDEWLKREAERVEQRDLLQKDEEYFLNYSSPMHVQLPSGMANSGSVSGSSKSVFTEIDVETFRAQLNREASTSTQK